MVVLDTCIIIEFLKGKTIDTLWDQLKRREPNLVYGISNLTIQELYEGISTRNTNKEQNMLTLIGQLKILPYTTEIAHIAGIITRDQKRYIGFADAAIAATAIIEQSPLATLNAKDYQDIPNLELITPKNII